MIIYIAGPITGVFDYREKFKRVERNLVNKGHIVINPSFIPNGLKDYMPTCKALIDQADAIYMMVGHADSVGATEELAYALETKKKVFCQKSY